MLCLLLQQNVLMQYSNNRNVFCRNNRNALFQYRPILVNCLEYNAINLQKNPRAARQLYPRTHVEYFSYDPCPRFSLGLG